MSDIVEWLRVIPRSGLPINHICNLCDDAATEIEKLREALDTAKTMLQTGLPEYDAADVLDVISAALGENK